MDKSLYEKIYNAYYMHVFSYAMTLTKDSREAEEITQETFYRVLTAGKSTFRGESEVVTWLCSIAKNLFIDETRRRKRHGEANSDIVCDLDIEKNIVDKEQVFKIHCILHELDEPYREVFELRVFGELSFAQIGKIFKKTENWARVTYHRAKLKISERMDKDE